MSTAKTRVLVVDDDPRLRDLLSRYLLEQGLTAVTARDGKAMERVLSREPIDVVVLDLTLPGEDGLSICKRLRAGGSDVGIVMLTARGEEVDRIVGLELGADDYLPKPFNPRELVARINAVLRRRQPAPPPGSPEPEVERITFGDCAVDLSTRTLVRGENESVLTTGEFSLLKVLVRHPHQPLSRDQLMLLARGREHEAFDRAIDVQISRLRKLIEVTPGEPRYLQTVRGYGYVFVPDGRPR